MTTLRLITIAISHYCEKARWALERAGLPYAEEPHAPLLHLWPVWRAGGGDSVPVLVADGGPPERARGPLLRLMQAIAGSTPGARSSGTKLAEADHTERRVFADSTDILRFVDDRAGLGLYPADSARRAEVEALEELFDETLGPHVRRCHLHKKWHTADA